MNALLRLAKNSKNFSWVIRRLLLVLLMARFVELIDAGSPLRPAVAPHGMTLLLNGHDVLAAHTERMADQTAVITTTVYLPLVSSGDEWSGGSGGWPMVAGNPQRTSWTPDELAANPHVEWYRPIDAFIPLNSQVIAANDMVYISSARGLYAMRYDTGDVVWRYDTEIPLGNSPTIATINGTSMAFVGGYDKKIHAFDALTGTPIWEFSSAQAGFDANPLVVNNTIYVGNRDGYFYAISAATGQLVWQYPAANQDPIGPIHLSPAYKNGVIYFATDYNYAYALNENGTLGWKSQKMVGDGYNSYWPVIYTEPTTNKDYVIFSGNIPYREGMRPGTRSYNDFEWYPYADGLDPVYQPITLSDPWAAGKTILNYSVSSEYLEQKPWQRIYTILDGTTGNEYTTDFDHDGKPEYLPVWPVANPNTQPPPVVRVQDDLIYFDNNWENGRGRVMGWKFGTPYFALSSIDHAADEPQIISGGGNYLFRNLCCSRVGDYAFFNDLLTGGSLWSYTLREIAPDHDQKIEYLTNPYILSGITAQYGKNSDGSDNYNGIYGYHGDQNQFVSYKGKAFVHRGNAIIAFGNGTAGGKLSLLTSASAAQNVNPVSDIELENRLEKEIQKIVNAGLLKPGYYEDSQFTNGYYLLDNYFDNPGDTLYTLSIAYPYLSSTLKAQVKNYITNTTNGIYTLYYQNGIINRIGWARGVQRDSTQLPPEVEADMQTLPDNYNWYLDGSLSWNYPLYIYTNPNNFYALYKYAQNVAPENVQSIYKLVVDTLTTGRCQYSDCTLVPPGADDATLIKEPYELNAYLAGYIGFSKLQELAGKTGQDSDLRTRMTAEYNRIKALRLDNFSKDTPFTTFDYGYDRNMVNISRNFIWLTPELAADLRNSRLAAVQQALDEYNTVAPYWFVSRFNAATAESGFQNLYDYPSNFQARAWILNASREELVKWLDVPAFERGDLFYIQNLVAAIEAPSSSTAISLAVRNR